MFLINNKFHKNYSRSLINDEVYHHFFIIFGHLVWPTKITRLLNIIKYNYPTGDKVSNNIFHIFINYLLT